MRQHSTLLQLGGRDIGMSTWTRPGQRSPTWSSSWLPNKKGKPKKAQTSRLLFLVGLGLGWLVGWLVFWLVSWLAGWLVWCWWLPVTIHFLLATANMADLLSMFFLLETDMLNPKNSVWGSSYEFSGSKFWLVEIQFLRYHLSSCSWWSCRLWESSFRSMKYTTQICRRCLPKEKIHGSLQAQTPI